VFAFQDLDVYRWAIRFLQLASTLSDQAYNGHVEVYEQLQRAALTIPISIAKGNDKGPLGERHARGHFRAARRSAIECAAIVDSLEALNAISPEDLTMARDILERIVSSLSRMA
jgi:four helix bundle protein